MILLDVYCLCNLSLHDGLCFSESEFWTDRGRFVRLVHCKNKVYMSATGVKLCNFWKKKQHNLELWHNPPVFFAPVNFCKLSTVTIWSTTFSGTPYICNVEAFLFAPVRKAPETVGIIHSFSYYLDNPYCHQPFCTYSILQRTLNT